MYPGIDNIQITIPEIKDGEVLFSNGEVRFNLKEIALEPGPTLPMSTINEEGIVEMTWPPKNSLLLIPPISPETESREFNGPNKWENISFSKDVPITIDRHGKRSLNVRLSWPVPLDGMFPTGGGIDLLWQYALMHHCIEELTEGRLTTRHEIANQFK